MINYSFMPSPVKHEKIHSASAAKRGRLFYMGDRQTATVTRVEPGVGK